MFSGFPEQEASTLLSQWKHFNLLAGMILLFDPWPEVIEHVRLLLHSLSSDDGKLPLQPLTVAPLWTLEKHWPSLGTEHFSACNKLGFWAQFAFKPELQMIQFSSLLTVSKLQSSRDEQVLHKIFELEQSSLCVCDKSDKQPFCVTRSGGGKFNLKPLNNYIDLNLHPLKTVAQLSFAL